MTDDEQMTFELGVIPLVKSHRIPTARERDRAVRATYTRYKGRHCACEECLVDAWQSEKANPGRPDVHIGSAHTVRTCQGIKIKLCQAHRDVWQARDKEAGRWSPKP